MIPRRALPLLLLAPAARAQEPPAAFIDLIPTEGRAAVRLNAMQVVRVARLDGATVLDTTAYVQQRSSESLDAVIRRLQAAGLRMVPLTDLNGGRTYLALDRIVVVRPSEERHAAGARSAIVVAGLRFATDVAVRETVAEAMAAIAAAH
ncbi:hypothetical protein JMJ55_15610 [Belnapia sp. T6]|uniref:Uncharacterized protein n=1 Tax=Belnapia mucosa TaxID=2804532 RepID=A0ABS1V4Y5_9PROT|nr:hypothetical protein [Belnapia mucosa]MBL6456763.1 hypothetical protein [Belnapia mucosa]